MVDSIDRPSLIDAAWDDGPGPEETTLPASEADPAAALATAQALFSEGRLEEAWELAEIARTGSAADEATALGALALGVELARAARDRAGAGGERLCIALRALGEAHLARGEAASAREVLATLVAEARALAREPTDLKAFRHLTSALHRLGDASHAEGDLPAAIGAYRDAVREAKRAAAANGDAPEALWELSVGLNRLGAAQLEADQAQAAIASFEQSVDARRAYCEQAGRAPEALSALASSLSKLAAALGADGDEAAARAASDEAAALDREAALGDGHHALTMVPPPAMG